MIANNYGSVWDHPQPETKKQKQKTNNQQMPRNQGYPRPTLQLSCDGVALYWDAQHNTVMGDESSATIKHVPVF